MSKLLIHNVQMSYRDDLFVYLHNTGWDVRVLKSAKSQPWESSEATIPRLSGFYLKGVFVPTNIRSFLKLNKFYFFDDGLSCVLITICALILRLFFKTKVRIFVSEIFTDYWWNNLSFKKKFVVLLCNFIRKFVSKFDGDIYVPISKLAENNLRKRGIATQQGIHQASKSLLRIDAASVQSPLFDKFVCGFIGNQSRLKGFDLICELAKDPNIFLSTAGGFSKDLTTYPNVQQHGVISESTDKKKFFSNISCLLHPSRHDCWAMVISEAAEMGVPTITTENVGAKDFLVHPDLVMKLFSAEEIQSKLELLIGNYQYYVDYTRAQYSRFPPGSFYEKFNE